MNNSTSKSIGTPLNPHFRKSFVGVLSTIRFRKWGEELIRTRNFVFCRVKILLHPTLCAAWSCTFEGRPLLSLHFSHFQSVPPVQAESSLPWIPMPVQSTSGRPTRARLSVPHRPHRQSRMFLTFFLFVFLIKTLLSTALQNPASAYHLDWRSWLPNTFCSILAANTQPIKTG